MLAGMWVMKFILCCRTLAQEVSAENMGGGRCPDGSSRVIGEMPAFQTVHSLLWIFPILPPSCYWFCKNWNITMFVFHHLYKPDMQHSMQARSCLSEKKNPCCQKYSAYWFCSREKRIPALTLVPDRVGRINTEGAQTKTVKLLEPYDHQQE